MRGSTARGSPSCPRASAALPSDPTVRITQGQDEGLDGPWIAQLSQGLFGVFSHTSPLGVALPLTVVTSTSAQHGLASRPSPRRPCPASSPFVQRFQDKQRRYSAGLRVRAKITFTMSAV